jgi:hypothetical protein
VRVTARKVAAALALLALIACAKMGAPPGGPPDKVPPKLLATVPESVGVYPNWKHDVEFRFDEIVSEGGSPNQGLGTGDLEKLILLSPSSKVPVIHWHRDRITVRPREGWKPNRVYRIELLPGITDLRRNRLDSVTVLTFSTGGALPTDSLRGIAIDWVQGRVASGALVEMILQPDSLVYRAVTDSGGRFNIGPLPQGNYLVYGVIDQNHDQRRGRRESYDSAVVTGGKTVPPLWLIPRDSTGPRISQVAQNDSVSATISFNTPLAPGQRFDGTNVVLRLQRDSSVIPIRSVLPRELDDSLQRISRAAADSLRIARDTTIPDSVKRARLAPPVSKAPTLAQRPTRQPRVDTAADSIIKSRPRLVSSLVLRVDSALVPETKYLIEVTGLTSAAGVPGSSRSVLAIPKKVVPPPRDSLKALGDSLKNPRDSLRTRRDTLKVRGDSLKADSTGAPTIKKKPVKPTTP